MIKKFKEFKKLYEFLGLNKEVEDLFLVIKDKIVDLKDKESIKIDKEEFGLSKDLIIKIDSKLTSNGFIRYNKKWDYAEIILISPLKLDTLKHELHHFFQYEKIENIKSIDDTNSYLYSLVNKDKEWFEDSKDSISNIVSQGLYFIDSMETGAKLAELHQSIKDNKDDFLDEFARFDIFRKFKIEGDNLVSDGYDFSLDLNKLTKKDKKYFTLMRKVFYSDTNVTVHDVFDTGRLKHIKTFKDIFDKFPIMEIDDDQQIKLTINKLVKLISRKAEVIYRKIAKIYYYYEQSN